MDQMTDSTYNSLMTPAITWGFFSWQCVWMCVRSREIFCFCSPLPVFSWGQETDCNYVAVCGNANKHFIRFLLLTVGKLSIRKPHSRVSGVLLGSPGESVLVHLSLPGDGTAVYLCVRSIQAAFPIICQLLCAAPQVKSIALLGFCHLINIYLNRSRPSTVCLHNLGPILKA